MWEGWYSTMEILKQRASEEETNTWRGQSNMHGEWALWPIPSSWERRSTPTLGWRSVSPPRGEDRYKKTWSGGSSMLK
jgi:hypothetical protein